MKFICSLITCILFIHLSPLISLSQWIPVYQDLDAQFHDASFPTDDIGYVAASDTGGRVVLRTFDGGQSWTKKYIPTWNFIDKIIMQDHDTGYLIKGGVPGQILKTDDGFETYTVHTTDTSFIVQSISLLNDSTGFYLNNAARLRKFENDGANFYHVIDSLLDGLKVQFVNSQTGFMDTGIGLLMTSDGGDTWSYANNDMGFYSVDFNFVDSMNGYFSDFTNIYRTSDGGVTFPIQHNFPNVYSIAANEVFCIAANDIGNVAYTLNSGESWDTEITGINLIGPEPYTVVTTPGGFCFLFSQYSGEIRKRQPIVVNMPPLYADHNISIYPNPATRIVNISSDKIHEDGTMLLYDGKGQLVKEIKNISGKMITFPCGDLGNGMYYLLLAEDGLVSMKAKIIMDND